MKNRLVESILWLLSKQGIPSVIPWAFGMIRSLYDGDPAGYLQLLEDQSNREEWIYHFFVAHEIGSLYGHAPDRVLEHLVVLSDSDVEIVREGCAHSWSEVLAHDFDEGLEWLREFQKNGSYEKRYTAAIAPVKFYRNNPDITAEQKQRIRTFWRDFRDDPKQGLWNIVRTQILPDLEDDHGG